MRSSGRRYINTLIPTIIFLSVLIMKQSAQTRRDLKIREIETGLFEIRLDNISLRVTRDGGKIISFKLDEQEMLTQKNVHGMYGSTLWPDPQSSWNWPPPQVLDENAYDGGIKGDSISLISGRDEKNGWQFEKVFSADAKDSSIKICYRIINISDAAKSVGPWEITRVPYSGLSFFRGGEPAGLPASDLNTIIIGNGIVWYAPDNIPFPGGKKFFATEKGGWLAYVYKNILLVKKFPIINLKYLAKGQGAIEIYSQGDMTYTEIENHGENKSLAPGESMEYNVRWYLRKLPPGIEPVPQNDRLVLEVEKIIK